MAIVTKDLKICTIGGGTGMPVVNKALVSAGYRNISSIVTTFDSGGDSGRMRTDERGKIMAFSDYWRSLISLWNDGEQKAVWEEMLRFRDGRGRNFGNIFFQFMTEKVGDWSEVDSLFAKLTGADLCGQVIPVTVEPSNLHFRTISGKEYVGEHMMDELRMSKDRIADVWLEPEVEANQEVVDALEKSEVIIFCPGSLYGSLVANLLPKGIARTLLKNTNRKVLITNIMSTANESDGYSQKEYIDTIKKFVGEGLKFDYVIMPDLDRLDGKLLKIVFDSYAMEGSLPIKHIIGYKSVKTILADIAMIEEKNMRLRHSENKLAILLSDLLE